MAVLGKIRSRGALLMTVLGVALFAFIAEEGLRSCEYIHNNDRQQIGEVLGEKISVTDFQKMLDEYSEVIKMQQGVDNLNEEQLNQVKDMVWNTYIQTKLVEDDAHKLGLTVTDEEMRNIMKQGTNPMLLQTPFVDQQTGRFDANALQKFLADYQQQQKANPQMAEQYSRIYKYWVFIEKTLRQQLLSQKYQSLLAHCMLSNPVEAKMAFNDENVESQIQLASFPYSSIADDKVKVADSDLKAKYDELKDRFKQFVETRDIKYIDVKVEPSNTDRAALQKEVNGYVQAFAAGNAPASVVSKSGSQVPYAGIAQSKTAFPSDIAAKLDSMSVGQTWGPVENKLDNTINVIHLIAKQQLADSIQFRQIAVPAQDLTEAKQKADSIYKAITAGADFSAVAKNYGQTGEQTWLDVRQMETSINNDAKQMLNALNTASVNEVRTVELSQGYIILQVNAKKAVTTKYNAAVIKKPIKFSEDTYRTAYNKFSSFISANTTAEALQNNAVKNGYQVQELPNVTTAQHYLANIRGTREALKWLFEASPKNVSPLYECGDNDHLLIVMLDKVHKKGYRTLDDADVKEMVKAEVLKDKKAEMLIAKAQGVNSIAAAKAKGAKVDAVNQITFAAPVFIATSGASEPALSGAVSAVAKGKFCATPVKGNAGVYFFQVTNRSTRAAKFDAKAEEAKLRQRLMQYMGNPMNELYMKANVVDNRYLFF